MITFIHFISSFLELSQIPNSPENCNNSPSPTDVLMTDLSENKDNKEVEELSSLGTPSAKGFDTSKNSLTNSSRKKLEGYVICYFILLLYRRCIRRRALLNLTRKKALLAN